jgi:hypothetical protein
VTARRRTLAAGLAVAVIYLAGAALSGHISVLARRPVLDGFGSVPPYHWVNPPAPLAPNNQKPSSATKAFVFSAGVLKGGVVSPNDLQITLILQDGAVAPAPGQRSVDVTMTPLDPATLGAAPSGLAFDGNAYRVEATYRPGGATVGALTVPADLALVYPSDATFGLGSIKHVILSSPTGTDWSTLSTTDLPRSQQASAKTSALGYFVIGRTGGAAAAHPSSRSFVPLIIAGAFVLLILLLTSPRVIRRLRRGGRGPDASPT